MNQFALRVPSAAALAALLLTAPASAKEVRIACDNSDNNDASLSARYIHTPARALFDASFKAPASTSYMARQSLEVRVDGVVVGYVELKMRTNGSFGASISFDSHANSGLSSDAGIRPFPAHWPGLLPPQPVGIVSGSRIMIGSIGCTLET